MKETLSEYVKRITDQKGLSLRELASRSGGWVTGSHLSKITKGASRNVTVETVVGLALGLGVDPQEVFSIASARSVKEATEAGPVDPLVLADAVKKLATTPQLLGLMNELASMSARDQEMMYDSLRLINERGEGKGKKKR